MEETSSDSKVSVAHSGMLEQGCEVWWSCKQCELQLAASEPCRGKVYPLTGKVRCDWSWEA